MISAKPTGDIELRDYFAGQALAAIIAKTEEVPSMEGVRMAAGVAYVYADAMLAARAEVKP